MKTIQTLTFAACSAVLASCGGEPAEKVGGVQASCETRAYGNIGGPIDLVNHNGERVSEADFIGAPTLIYFGFTYCPDICPGTLVAVNKAYEQLPEGIAPPQTVLITVDPERDTPEALATYVATSVFPDNLVGLTGSPQQVRAAADAFMADYSRVEANDSLAEYTMDHTSLLYLMDENWKLKTFFAESDSNPEEMARCLAKQLSN